MEKKIGADLLPQGEALPERRNLNPQQTAERDEKSTLLAEYGA
jgi:hypothetical protein